MDIALAWSREPCLSAFLYFGLPYTCSSKMKRAPFV